MNVIAASDGDKQTKWVISMEECPPPLPVLVVVVQKRFGEDNSGRLMLKTGYANDDLLI